MKCEFRQVRISVLDFWEFIRDYELPEICDHVFSCLGHEIDQRALHACRAAIAKRRSAAIKYCSKQPIRSSYTRAEASSQSLARTPCTGT
jgi:hypothetical protein